MPKTILIVILILMLLPSTNIKIQTKWFEYEYSAKRMYDMHTKLFK